MQPINAQELVLKIKRSNDLRLIDVREHGERAQGYLADSQHIPLNELSMRAKSITGSPIVTYCRSGVRAKKAAEILTSSGFKAVFYLTTHSDDWEKEGLNIVR